MKKLDESKVRWIIAQKRKGATANHVAQTMDVSTRWVKRLWARYRHADAGKTSYPARMGRPENGLPGRRERSAVFSVRYREHLGAAGMQDGIGYSTGINIPHSTTRRILRDEHLASGQPKKSQRRKWIRYERAYSNSMWHTDFKLPGDGRWFPCHEGDASRFVTGYGAFEHAATENALAVLEGAVKNHGKPASIVTGRGSQIYATRQRQRGRGRLILRRGWSGCESARFWRAPSTSRPTAGWRGCTGRSSASCPSLRQYRCARAIP